MTYIPQKVTGVISENSTTTPLTASSTYTGTAKDVSKNPSVVIAVKTDQTGTLFVDFSNDGTNWDSTLSYQVLANTNEVHRLTVTRKYFRVRFTNTSATDQTFLRLQSAMGDHVGLASPLNLSIQQDTDAILVRSLDSEIDIINEKYNGYFIENKYGKNPDVDSGSTPEDIWSVGGVYTGWATVAQTVTLVSTSLLDTLAGTGAQSVIIYGLNSNYELASETVNMSGIIPVVTSGSFIRVHKAQVVTAGAGGSNAGTISVYQTVTTTNVFASIIIGANESTCSAYTVPAGYSAYMKFFGSATGNQSAVSVDGCLYFRPFGSVFYESRPYFIGNGFALNDGPFGGLKFTEKTDIIVRILSCSTNNTPVNCSYTLLMIKN